MPLLLTRWSALLDNPYPDRYKKRNVFSSSEIIFLAVSGHGRATGNGCGALWTVLFFFVTVIIFFSSLSFLFVCGAKFKIFEYLNFVLPEKYINFCQKRIKNFKFLLASKHRSHCSIYGIYELCTYNTPTAINRLHSNNCHSWYHWPPALTQNTNQQKSKSPKTWGPDKKPAMMLSTFQSRETSRCCNGGENHDCFSYCELRFEI